MRTHEILQGLTLAAFVCGGAHAQTLSSSGTLQQHPFARHNQIRNLELAGNSLGLYPHFEFVAAFNEGSTVEIAVDTLQVLALAGVTADVYVVDAKTATEWDANPTLTDVTGGPQSISFTLAPITMNRFTVDTGTLSGDGGLDIGVGYDVVIDVDGDGQLGPADYIDGYGNEAGFYVVDDITLPGPLAVTEISYTGGTFLGQNTFYPTNIAAMGQLPLVVVSHGNGHNYNWYDHIGVHMASHGYVVMSHQNNTVPGPASASLTTLSNTAYLLNNQGTIAGGVLNGHIDNTRITWIGHSRGGEGVAIAYDRLFDGTSVPSGYTIDAIKLISSIAPTDFQGPAQANPHDAVYHLWTGGADADVNGCASCNLCQTFHLHERAESTRHSISLHGVGHGAFHNGGGSLVATGPCLVSRPDTHKIMFGHFYPLVQVYMNGNVPAKDFLWRQWEAFKPIGAPGTSCVVVDLMLQEDPAARFSIDNFQINPATALSSSGGVVLTDVNSLAEGRLDDPDGDFTHAGAESFNGYTLAGTGDLTRGWVFQWGEDKFISFEIVASARDFTEFAYLSFRAAQQPRHPNTTAVLGDLDFSVELTDGAGTTSRIAIAAYGGGIEEPYQRTSCGTGAGWAAEFETIRIRLTDFQHSGVGGLPGGVGLDLTDIVAVDFLFGPTYGDSQGRLGLDEVELTRF